MSDIDVRAVRVLVAKHVDEDVSEVVLKALDAWAVEVVAARAALEQAQRSASDLKRYYTVPELMRLMGRSDSRVRSLIEDGKLPCTRIEGSIRVSIEAVERYLAENTTNKPLDTKPTTARRGKPVRDDVAQDAIERYPFLAS